MKYSITRKEVTFDLLELTGEELEDLVDSLGFRLTNQRLSGSYPTKGEESLRDRLGKLRETLLLALSAAEWAPTSSLRHR